MNLLNFKSKKAVENVEDGNVKIERLLPISDVVPKDFVNSEAFSKLLEPKFYADFINEAALDDFSGDAFDGFIDAFANSENIKFDLDYIEHLSVCDRLDIAKEEALIYCNKILEFIAREEENYEANV